MDPNPFVVALETALAQPVDNQQLTRAVAAHRSLLVWEQDKTVKNWKRFIKVYLKVGVSEF